MLPVICLGDGTCASTVLSVAEGKAAGARKPKMNFDRRPLGHSGAQVDPQNDAYRGFRGHGVGLRQGSACPIEPHTWRIRFAVMLYIMNMQILKMLRQVLMPLTWSSTISYKARVTR